MVKRRAKSLLPIIIAVAVIGGLMFWRQSPRPAAIDVIALPSPSPESILSSQSSDGKIALTLGQKKGTDTTTWSLTVSQSGALAKKIWSAALPHDTTFSIPFNAVSPDNKYLFLKQTEPDKTRYLVLSTSGAPISQDSQTIEFAGLFESKYPEYKITAVTGWGGLNLIVINTDKIKGGTGPSFWFDLSGHSFIQLSTRFE
jgi:hypothetical protein